MKAFSVKYSPEAARFLLSFKPLAEEAVSLHDALGRTLARHYAAPEDFPPYNRALSDGYALASADSAEALPHRPVTLPLAFECRSGDAHPPALPAGHTARIWTGCMLPGGADCVLPDEDATPLSRAVRVTSPMQPGANCLPPGCDIAQGATLLQNGHVLREQDIALLSAFGITTVHVRRIPKVTVISSGNEIVPSAMHPSAGQARDSNAYAFVALCKACGAQTNYLGIVKDDPGALAAQIGIALGNGANAVLISGGSSSGKLDITLQAMRSVPSCTIVEHTVPMSSGKPFAMARAMHPGGVGESAVWGLPGHALGALMCAELFVRPLLFRLQGGNHQELPPPYKAVLAENAPARPGRSAYFCLMPCPDTHTGSAHSTSPRLMRPVPAHSGLLSAMVSVSGVARCDSQCAGLRAGQEIDVYPFGSLPFLHDALAEVSAEAR